MSSFTQSRLLQVFRRHIHVGQVKHKKLPDPWDLMTGIERWEALQYAKGNTDPFDRVMKIMGPGTRDCPNVITSVHDKRIVGCLCNHDAGSLKFFFLHEGFPRRCECNRWFVLKRVELPKIYEDCPPQPPCA